MHDVDPRLYTTVIREMIRHENDVTNHRIMWLLIVQGLIANAAVAAGRDSGEIVQAFAGVGILVTLSTFALLYKGYQARGYLQFLGEKAKQGALREEALPLIGWPGKRFHGWRKEVWRCLWVGKVNELMEPLFFLPTLVVTAWLFVMFRYWLALNAGLIAMLSTAIAVILISGSCVTWVWRQRKDEVYP